jgi:transposase
LCAKKDDLMGDLSKGGGNWVFDGGESEGFDGEIDTGGRVFDTKKRVKVKSKPKYRCVGRNFKSSKKYWQERNRRKQVIELLEQNLSVKQIAEKVGVCERTVKRDIAKIKPYYERRVRHLLNQADEKERLELEAEVEGLSPKQLKKFLESKIKERDHMLNLLKQREYLRHQLLVTIDLDDLGGGFPKIIHSAQMPFSVKFPFNVNFAFKKNGVTTQVQGIRIGNQT